MKTPIAKAVKASFENGLFSLWPFFERNTDEPLPRECRLYRWAASPVTFFVTLQTHRRDDSFTIELGWSLDGVSPLLFLARAPVPEGAQAYKGYRFRLVRLWEDSDKWWEVQDPSAADAAVSDAVGHLQSHGEPYLRDVAKQLGVAFGSG